MPAGDWPNPSRVWRTKYPLLFEVYFGSKFLKKNEKFLESRTHMSDISETQKQQHVAWGPQTLTLETGRIARQADGAVYVSYGDTRVLCTAVAARQAKPDLDFLPLTVNYQEKTFAAGKIPGGFFKREGRPSEKETLVSRLIDRPIRPLFPSTFRNEIHVVCTVLSFDGENDSDVIAMTGASAALGLAGVPFGGPIAGARVGLVNDAFVLNPTTSQLAESRLNLVMACTREGILMVESEAHELSETQMLEALQFGHQACGPVLDTIEALVEQAGKPRWVLPETPPEVHDLYRSIKSQHEQAFTEAYRLTDKVERGSVLENHRASILEALPESTTPEMHAAVPHLTKKLEKEVMRGALLAERRRIDGRALDTIRPIHIDMGFLPRTHGSALFTRGETQALVVATLGSSTDEQIIDTLEKEYKESFLLHYNFPPYSVGEARPMRPPGRREIGHGKLAWRALRALLPSKMAFPYTLRLVSEITESNGSSSMATVCGGSLALMDAGVPLPRHVAGIAMGLVKEADEYAILSDILGDEDHLGDMDFKVAGTHEGITALQMDIKITSVTFEMMAEALEQARKGRLFILDRMAEALPEPRTELSPYAPIAMMIQIDKEKIRDVIGTGGKVIREITEATGCKIDIEDSGEIRVFAQSQEAGERTKAWIEQIVAEPTPGQIYEGTVARIADFGAFVDFLNGHQTGLAHISELADYRVGKVEDIVNVGDKVWVLCQDVDPRGKIDLSIRMVDQTSGTLRPDAVPRPSGRDRGGAGRGGDRHGGGGFRDGGRDRDGGSRGGGGYSRSGGGGGYRDGGRDRDGGGGSFRTPSPSGGGGGGPRPYGRSRPPQGRNDENEVNLPPGLGGGGDRHGGGARRHGGGGGGGDRDRGGDRGKPRRRDH